MKKFSYIFALIVVLWITGCADAGKDKRVNTGDTVYLDGNASQANFGGEITQYQWTQIDGKDVNLSDAQSMKASFIAPSVTQESMLTFELTTTEMGGWFSPWKTKDRVNITIKPHAPPPNTAPNAVASADVTHVEYGEAITFDANNSSDSDGKIVSYRWSEKNITLSTQEGFSHSFDISGEHTITLVVTDNGGLQDSDDITITVDPQLQSLQIESSTLSLEINETATVVAMASYDDNTTQNVSDSVEWVLSDNSIIFMEANATIRGLDDGVATVTAKIDGIVSNILTIEVKSPVILKSLSVSPDPIKLIQNHTVQLDVIGLYSNGNTETIKNAMYAIANTAIASVNSSGFVKAHKEGNTTLEVSVGTVKSTIDVAIESNASDQEDEFNQTTYRGLSFYYKNMATADYTLDQLSDNAFAALDSSTQLKVANKLLSSLFFGYPLNDLRSKISTGDFLSTVKSDLEEERVDKGWLESYILDDSVFKQYQHAWSEPQVITILSRFYAMNDLDRYFLNNWTAYILTQTIMFSPAYELSSAHTPNISGVYNHLVTMLENKSGMRYITYVHMMSENNWRRFRSPEDNGREMLEIYLLDTNDSYVPLAGKALQNWKLNNAGDTLEVGLNRNRQEIQPLTNLFGGEAVITGEDFYRELVKSDAFTRGVTSRLVDFFFPAKSTSQKQQISHAIVSSHPETWQDILLQIIFSEEYLLHNTRAKSTEETFYALTKKINYRARRDSLKVFKNRLKEMHQASMKYKLGKLERVPLDSLSFAHYHKYIRESILVRRANPEQTDPDSWEYHGWQDSFISFDKFSHNENNASESLKNLVDLIFETTVSRKATSAEHALFKNHMIRPKNGNEAFTHPFNMFVEDDDQEKQAKEREYRKGKIAMVVLDYISRLDETYRQREVH